MSKIRGVILDLDGTLVDSNDAHARAWLQAMEEEGFRPEFEKVRRLIGMGGTFLIPEALGIGSDSPQGKKIRQRRQEIFKNRYLPYLRPFPRVRELIERLQESGIQRVIASASKKEEVEKMLEIASIDDLMDGVTSASDVEDPKPEPDVLAAALDKVALEPEQVFLLGDTPYDLQAGAKIGVGVIALECGGWRASELKGAVAVYRDPADLLEHFQTSPLVMWI